VIHLKSLLLAGLALTLTTLSAQSLQQITTEQTAKLEASLERLRNVRETIAEEQLPLARKLQSLDQSANELEVEAQRVQRLRDSKQMELQALRERVSARQNEVDFVTRSVIPSFVADYDAELSPGERTLTGERIRNYNLYLEDVDASELDKLDASLELLQTAAASLRSELGGQQLSGSALAEDGSVHRGHFVELGPLTYFVADQAEIGGLVFIDSLDTPQVQSIDKATPAQIREILTNGSGPLPIDPTLGDALAVAATKDSLSQHLTKGGVWVYPILLFALVATIVSIYKAIQVFSIRAPEPMVIHDIIQHLRNQKPKEAMQLAQAQPQPMGPMLVTAVDHADESAEMVEEVMYESMLTTQPKLERFLNVIAVTAAAAPLLGLLGTVTGIIKTFRLMSVFGAGDPKPLISGISEALITTELGLILAIPALVMHAILSRKVAGIMARMEKTAVTFVNGLARNAPTGTRRS